MNSVCAFCMQRVYSPSLSSVPCYPWQARTKICQFGFSEILLLQGKLHLRVWARFLLLLSSVSFLISPRLAFPPCYGSLLLHCSLYFNMFGYPFSFLCVSLSLVAVSPGGGLGSERRFGAGLRQSLTLIKRMLGSSVGELVCLALFFIVGKEYTFMVAPGDLFENFRMTFP